jgi:chemotaxis protein methyltransferase CheR
MLANHLNLTSTVTDPILEKIQQWIHFHTGIHFNSEKISLLEQRLDALRFRNGIQSNQELMQKVENEKDQVLIKQLIDVATTNHTHFYRETDSLFFFRDHIANSFNNGKTCRVWSAASSSGEELYTLALLLVEKYALNHIKTHFSFLGTDLNQRVIEHAELAIYHQQRLADMPKDIQNKWFQSTGLEQWSLHNDIKQLCTFRRLNLKKTPWPFSRFFHCVFLRNVLYYFDAKTQEEIVNQVYKVTEPNGFLITSVTESLANLKTPWQKVHAGVYQKRP